MSAVICSGCTNDIDPRRHLLCRLCEDSYCLECANVSEQRYYNTMNAEHKSKWKCPACYSCQPRGDNSNTPVGVHVNLCADNENVTMRRGPLSQPKCVMDNTLLDESVNTFALRELIREELSVALCDNLADKLSQAIVDKIEVAINSALGNLTTLISSIVEDKLKVLDGASTMNSEVTNNSETSKITTQKTVVSKTKNTKAPSLTRKMAGGENTKQLSQAVPERAYEANVNSAVESSCPVVLVEDPRENPWTVVKKKRSRVMCGSAAPGTSQLEASERVRHLHLYYVKVGTSVEQIRLHLNTVCNSSEVTSIESLKARGNYASFKLTVTWSSADKVMASEAWPQGVCIKPWSLPFRGTQNGSRKEN